MDVRRKLLGGLEPEFKWRIFVLQLVAEESQGICPARLYGSGAFSRSTVRLFFEPRLRPPHFLRSGGMAVYLFKIRSSQPGSPQNHNESFP